VPTPSFVGKAFSERYNYLNELPQLVSNQFPIGTETYVADARGSMASALGRSSAARASFGAALLSRQPCPTGITQRESRYLGTFSKPAFFSFRDSLNFSFFTNPVVTLRHLRPSNRSGILGLTGAH
jgi:hypothetical protein